MTKYARKHITPFFVIQYKEGVSVREAKNAPAFQPGAHVMASHETFSNFPKNQSDQQFVFGFTASKKVGNAVKRNRAKRRLRTLARLYVASNNTVACSESLQVSNTTHIVFVARTALVSAPFNEVQAALVKAMHALKKGSVTSQDFKSHNECHQF